VRGAGSGTSFITMHQRYISSERSFS